MFEAKGWIRISYVNRGEVSPLCKGTNTSKGPERDRGMAYSRNQKVQWFLFVCFVVFCFGIKVTGMKGDRIILKKN